MAKPFRFGVNFGGTFGAAEWTAAAREAERRGYSTIHFADHFGMLDPLAALAVAGAATEKIRLGAYVLCNDFRHPAVLAREAATVDVLSGGRLELGLGAGWRVDEYEKTGLRFDGPAVRMNRLEESIAFLRGAFGDGPFSHEGRYYSARDLDGLPKPVQRPHPPIMIGASRPKMLSLAARVADIVAFAPQSTRDGRLDCSDVRAEALEKKIEIVRAAAGERFDRLELNTMMTAPVVVTDDREKGARGILDFLRSGAFPILVPDDFRERDVLESPFYLIGTHAEIADQVVELRRRYGISYVTVMFMSMSDFAPVIEKLAGR